MEDKKMMEIINNNYKKVRMENIKKAKKQEKRRNAKEFVWFTTFFLYVFAAVTIALFGSEMVTLTGTLTCLFTGIAITTLMGISTYKLFRY
ncbi:MAG: hypothetical protein IKE89_02205 [Bacilli bacterium]|nr:hypothetical protein [Bacilli bacterium]